MNLDMRGKICLVFWGYLFVFAFGVTSQEYGQIVDMANNTRCVIERKQSSVDCSHRHLLNIPNTTFPSDTLEINLSWNSIRRVQNSTFVGFRNLRNLDLSFNRICVFEPLSFQGLYRLDSLNLSANYLALIPEVFSATLFAPLKQLITLSVQNMSFDTPKWKGIDSGLSMLTNLRHLDMDFPFNFTFGEEFAKLTQLRTISTSGSFQSCSVLNLLNNTFDAFTNISLQELRIRNCKVFNIEAGTFLPLKNLSILDLSNNGMLGLRFALQTLYGLQNRTMQEINFSGLNGMRALEGFSISFNKTGNAISRAAIPNLTTLFDSDVIYLTNMCVQHVDLSENYISSFVHDLLSFSGLTFGRADCLVVLKMSNHAMRYLPTPFLHEIKRYTNMEFADVSGGLHGLRLVNEKQTGFLTPVPPSPPPLLTLNASNCLPVISLIDSAFKNMKSLNMTNNIDRCDFEMGPQEPTVELDMSGLLCSDFNTSLTNFPNLRKLTVRNAPNIYISIGDSEGTVDSFQPLLELQELDLSGNKLTELNKNLLIKNTKLRWISLSNNKLQRVPSAIMKLKNLSSLDLSGNAFTHLTEAEMFLMGQYRFAQVDMSRFRLNLRLNPLQCTCETLDFIDWIYRNERLLDEADTYTCLLSNGTRVDLASFKTMIKNVSINCVSHTWILIGVIGLLLVLILIVLFYVVYRYRTNLRYWLYTKLTPPADMLALIEYEYDAFVGYTEENYHWVFNELRQLENGAEPMKLCIHKRDFTAGKPIHENIVDTMKRSKKVILIITTDFIKSDYGPMEIEYAGMKSLEEGRDDLIICVLLEDIAVRDMPRALRNLWHKITFLKWPEDPGNQQHFWNQLRNAIGDIHG